MQAHKDYWLITDAKNRNVNVSDKIPRIIILPLKLQFPLRLQNLGVRAFFFPQSDYLIKDLL